MTPTITSITPSNGASRGRALVAITGTGFARHVRVTFTDPEPDPKKTTGSERAWSVTPLTDTLVHVLTPIHGASTCDVILENLDADGAPIPGERVVVPGGYTFALPDLARRFKEESGLGRIVRTFLRELKRQLITNVEMTVAVDFDDLPDGANVAMVSTLPSLVVAGPNLRESRFYSSSAPRFTVINGQTFQQRKPRTVDILFTIVGAHDNALAAINFLNETVLFFDSNKWLRVLKDPTVPGDYAQIEMEIEDQFAATGQANTSNIHSFQGTIVLRGVALEYEDTKQRLVYPVRDVTVADAIGLPSPMAIVGAPGVPLPSALTEREAPTVPDPNAPPYEISGPIPQNPPVGLGNSGSIEQIPPSE